MASMMSLWRTLLHCGVPFCTITHGRECMGVSAKHCLVGSKYCGAEVSLKSGAPGVVKLTLRPGGCVSNALTSQACWPHPDAVVCRRAQSTQAYESAQIQFLQNALATSTATYNFVTAH
jgi:hypothetical protein